MRLLSVGVPSFRIFSFRLPVACFFFFWMCNLLDAPLLDATCCVLVGRVIFLDVWLVVAAHVAHFKSTIKQQMYLHMASRLNYRPHAKTMQHAKPMLQAASRQLNHPMFGFLVRLRQVPVHRHCHRFHQCACRA